MPKLFSRFVLLSMLAASSCTAEEDAGRNEAPADPQVEPPAPDAPAPERPQTRADTILVEGMPQVVELRLIHEPQGFAIPFSSYVPEGFQIESTEIEGAAALRFVAAFGGVLNPAAFLEVAPYPEGLARDEAMRRAGSELPAAEPVPDTEAVPWAIGEWRARGTEATGPFTAVARLTTHGDRFVRVTMRYPVEYGDGFPPRAAVILEEWRWGDGSPLVQRGRRLVP